MATKAPLLEVSAKIGHFGAARTIKVEGTGAITKSHGHLVLRAGITESEARNAAKLAELAKRVPVEQEARTRAKAGFGLHPKGDDAFVKRHGADPILVMRGDNLTYAGHAYMQEAQTNPQFSAEAQRHAKTILGARGGSLHDPHMPKRPEQREDETDEAFAKRLTKHERAVERRKAANEKSIQKRDAGAADLNRLKVQLIEDPGMSARINRVLDADGEANPHREPQWTMTVDHPSLDKVEYVRFTEAQILQVNREIQEMRRHRDEEAQRRVDHLPPGARIARPMAPMAEEPGPRGDRDFALPPSEPASQADKEYFVREILRRPNGMAMLEALVDEALRKGSVDVRIGDRMVNFHKRFLESTYFEENVRRNLRDMPAPEA